MLKRRSRYVRHSNTMKSLLIWESDIMMSVKWWWFFVFIIIYFMVSLLDIIWYSAPSSYYPVKKNNYTYVYNLTSRVRPSLNQKKEIPARVVWRNYFNWPIIVMKWWWYRQNNITMITTKAAYHIYGKN